MRTRSLSTHSRSSVLQNSRSVSRLFPPQLRSSGPGGVKICQTASKAGAESVAQLYLYATRQAPLRLGAVRLGGGAASVADGAMQAPTVPLPVSAAAGLPRQVATVLQTDQASRSGKSLPRSQARAAASAIALPVPAAVLITAEPGAAPELGDLRALLDRAKDAELFAAFNARLRPDEVDLLARAPAMRSELQRMKAAAALEEAATAATGTAAGTTIGGAATAQAVAGTQAAVSVASATATAAPQDGMSIDPFECLFRPADGSLDATSPVNSTSAPATP